MKDAYSQQVSESVESIAKHWDRKPRFGIVLGTGAGNIADQIDAQATVPYGSIAHFPTSTATGHKGNLVCGELAGELVIAMQGRFHLYEGYSFDAATLPIHVMQRMGVEVLFVSNAAGGLNPKMECGDVMAIESHLDLMFRPTQHAFPEHVAGRPALPPDSALDPRLIEMAMSTARANGFALHQGVYAAMLGPAYETRAEYRCLRRLGADAAGMSTVPEITVASKYGIRALAISIITNVAKPDALDETSGEEVVEAGRLAAPKLQKIVCSAIQALSC